MCGLFTAFIFLIIQMQARPFREPTDDYMALACGILLTGLFVVSIGFKYGALTQLTDLQERMSLEQKADYLVSHVLLSAIAVVCCVGTFVVLAVILAVQARNEARRTVREARAAKARRLRYLNNGREVDPPAIHEKHFHLFLSHAWAQGEGAMPAGQV